MLFWTLEDLAKLFGVSKQTVRNYLIKEKCVPYRLQRIGNHKAQPVLDNEQALRLMDIKRPIFGSGSVLDRIFNHEHEARTRAGGIGGRKRWANHVKTKPKQPKP